MPDTSGPSSLTPLAFYDPGSSCWKTSAGTFPWEPPPCLETLPASGMTLAGVLYGLPMSGPATAEPASSSLPTPTVGDSKSGKEVAMLPTPTVADDMGTTYRNPRADANFDTSHAVTLAQVAYRRFHEECPSRPGSLMPTPTSRDGKGRNQRDDETCLPGAVGNLLPTPRASERENRSTARTPSQIKGNHGLYLAAEAVLASNGALTDPPLRGTPVPSADQPPTLWMDEDD